MHNPKIHIMLQNKSFTADITHNNIFSFPYFNDDMFRPFDNQLANL